MDLIGGVDGDQHSADFGGGPEGDEPLGHIGGPDGHMVAGFHPHGDEGPGKLIYVIPELGIGPGVVQGGIAESILIRELVDHPV